MIVDDFFRDAIFTWEDGRSTDPARTHSLDPDDNGNWTGGACGQGACVGSNHGVTPAALAEHLGCAPAVITRDRMHALTLDEAVTIGEQLYYRGTGLDLLPWDAVIASATDFGWGAGPGMAKRLIQRMIAVAEDGRIGPFTIRAYAQFVASHGIEEAARLWQAQRNLYYQRCVAARPVNARYLKGWMNRAAHFAPGGAWWASFAGQSGAASERLLVAAR